MKVGDLVRYRRGAFVSRQLGVIAKKGHSKCFVSWLDGMSSWCVLSMLEVVNESR
jgi:hypothetical protein